MLGKKTKVEIPLYAITGVLNRLMADQTVAGPQSGTTTKTAKQSLKANPLLLNCDDTVVGNYPLNTCHDT